MMSKNQIPKIIHYCWFGGNPLPEITKLCLESWRTLLPDYEIVCWSEENFDVSLIPFVQEAYEAKKWAFVSDYARLFALYQYGGIYLDTDEEEGAKDSQLLQKILKTAANSENTGVGLDINSHPNGEENPQDSNDLNPLFVA